MVEIATACSIKSGLKWSSKVKNEMIRVTVNVELVILSNSKRLTHPRVTNPTVWYHVTYKSEESNSTGVFHLLSVAAANTSANGVLTLAEKLHACASTRLFISRLPTGLPRRSPPTPPLPCSLSLFNYLMSPLRGPDANRDVSGTVCRAEASVYIWSLIQPQTDCAYYIYILYMCVWVTLFALCVLPMMLGFTEGEVSRSC